MKNITQADILRKMTGEQRLDQAFALSELVRTLAKTNIREQLGKAATEEKVLKELRKRLNIFNKS